VPLYRGMSWLQFALLAAYVGPLWHSLLVYLDSCPFLPLFTLAHWFELAPHVVGSWRVGALPGNYGTEEWQTIASLSAFRPLPLAASCIFCTSRAGGGDGTCRNCVQTLYYGLGIIFMLGGVVAAYVKALQLRVGKQEKDLSEYKLYVAERYASKEYLSERKREILDSIRDLARRIEHP
jgi:hypothetical protein